MNAHVFTLSELIAAKIWLPRKVFMAPVNSTSWQVSEDKRVPIHHYTKDSEHWRCRVCHVLTPNSQSDECSNGHVPRIVRQLDGDESCSSYDEESSASSSSDSSSDYDSDFSGSRHKSTCDPDDNEADVVPKGMSEEAIPLTLKKLPPLVISATRTQFKDHEDFLKYRRQKNNEYTKLLTQGYGIHAFSVIDQNHIRDHNRERKKILRARKEAELKKMMETKTRSVDYKQEKSLNCGVGDSDRGQRMDMDTSSSSSTDSDWWDSHRNEDSNTENDA